MSGLLGFDPSLVSSGFAYSDIEGRVHTGRILPKKLKGTERLVFIRQKLEILLDTTKAEMLIYEGYSMGSKGRSVYDIGELGGILKTKAFERGVEVLLVPPASLKQFATGKGNADKDKVIASVASNWGFNIPHNDEADAFALLKFGEAYRNQRKRRGYPAIQSQALYKARLISGAVKD